MTKEQRIPVALEEKQEIMEWNRKKYEKSFKQQDALEAYKGEKIEAKITTEHSC